MTYRDKAVIEEDARAAKLPTSGELRDFLTAAKRNFEDIRKHEGGLKSAAQRALLERKTSEYRDFKGVDPKAPYLTRTHPFLMKVEMFPTGNRVRAVAHYDLCRLGPSQIATVSLVPDVKARGQVLDLVDPLVVGFVPESGEPAGKIDLLFQYGETSGARGGRRPKEKGCDFFYLNALDLHDAVAAKLRGDRQLLENLAIPSPMQLQMLYVPLQIHLDNVLFYDNEPTGFFLDSEHGRAVMYAARWNEPAGWMTVAKVAWDYRGNFPTAVETVDQKEAKELFGPDFTMRGLGSGSKTSYTWLRQYQPDRKEDERWPATLVSRKKMDNARSAAQRPEDDPTRLKALTALENCLEKLRDELRSRAKTRKHEQISEEAARQRALEAMQRLKKAVALRNALKIAELISDVGMKEPIWDKFERLCQPIEKSKVREPEKGKGPRANSGMRCTLFGTSEGALGYRFETCLVRHREVWEEGERAWDGTVKMTRKTKIETQWYMLAEGWLGEDGEGKDEKGKPVVIRRNLEPIVAVSFPLRHIWSPREIAKREPSGQVPLDKWAMILALQELEAQEGVKVELPYSLDRSHDEEKAHLPEQIQFLWDHRPAYIDQPIVVPRPAVVRLNQCTIDVTRF